MKRFCRKAFSPNALCVKAWRKVGEWRREKRSPFACAFAWHQTSSAERRAHNVEPEAASRFRLRRNGRAPKSGVLSCVEPLHTEHPEVYIAKSDGDDVWLGTRGGGRGRGRGGGSERHSATVTLMWPSSLRSRLDGLMSRWQIFWWCTACGLALLNAPLLQEALTRRTRVESSRVEKSR